MLKWVIILSFLITPNLLLSQVFSRKGRFSVESNKGCAPFTVNITEIETFGTNDIRYFYFEGAASTGETTFTYTETGTYQIVQLINTTADPDKFDTLDIEVIEPIRPEIEVTRCNNFEVAIRSVDTFYDSIRVYFGGADSSTLLINESTSFTFSSTNTQTIGTKGFFANAREVCDTYFEEISPISELQAPQIVRTAIKESCQDRYTIYLSLSDFLSEVNYRVILTQSTEQVVFDGFIDSTELIVGNIPFEIRDFCVTVEAYDPCSGGSSRSAPSCGIPSTLSLSPFESLFSSYNESDIYINVDDVSSGTFLVQRRFEGSEFQDRNEVLSSFNDPIGTNTRKYFYKLLYFDSCGSVLYTAETHPPLIEARPLSENEYRVSFEPARSSISSLATDSFAVGNTKEAILTSEFDIQLSSQDGVPTQSLSASSSYATGERLRSNTALLKYELVIHAPSAFTPNGDGLNDSMEFFGLPSNNAELKIYSKWGQLIYSSVEVEKGWDGMLRGSPAPEGTYLYEITFESETGEVLRQKGTFALIK